MSQRSPEIKIIVIYFKYRCRYCSLLNKLPFIRVVYKGYIMKEYDVFIYTSTVWVGKNEKRKDKFVKFISSFTVPFSKTSAHV